MQQRSTKADEIKSLIRKNLLASPSFTRLYADLLISEGYNPNEARDLAERYKKKFGADMPVNASVKTCTHIKVTGVRCGSPALRGEEFCYFHQRMIRTVKAPNSRLHHVALLENEEAIQASIMEVVNALIRGTVDLKRGELILRALNTAVRNSRRARFDISTSDMVRELPDFNEEAEPEAIPATTAAEYSAYFRNLPRHPPAVATPDPTQRKPPLGVKASPKAAAAAANRAKVRDSSA